jgi:hypothetical protein
MTTEDALRQIESLEFGAYVGVASSLKVFVRLLASHEAVQALLHDEQVGVARMVLERVVELLTVRAEPGFEHPHDAALAAFAWLLSELSPETAEYAAGLIRATPGLHWATHFAERISDPNRLRSKATIPIQVNLPQPTAHAPTPPPG